jgi:DNA-directed RNA polymerase subunit RPC12/RpoP
VTDSIENAVAYFQWCWDCGSTLANCDELRPDKKCCPDCRHRILVGPFRLPAVYRQMISMALGDDIEPPVTDSKIVAEAIEIIWMYRGLCD